MKNLFTKLLSLAIVLCILTALVPMAHATEKEKTFTSGDHKYRLLDDGTAAISLYSGEVIDYSIPETIDGYTVSTVDLVDGYNIEKLYIPASVKEISGSALRECRFLSEIEVDENNEYYTAMDNVLFSKDMSVLVAFPRNKSCVYYVPNEVKVIGDSAFEHNYILSKLVLPENLEEIKSRAFYGLRFGEDGFRLEIPASVKKFGEDFLGSLESAVGTDWDTIALPVYVTEGSPAEEHLKNIKSEGYPDGYDRFAYDIPDEVFEIFTDVKSSDWFALWVDRVVHYSLMQGKSETTFAPNDDMTRAMVVTVLWRLAGEPEAGASTFTDLTQDWYKTAVAWAAENGIVLGKSETEFAPDEAVTREQLATLLHRYAEFMEYDTSAAGDLTVFPDAADTSDWAEDALTWANGAGLINGTARADGNYLDPKGFATRAQVAKILAVFHGEYVTAE